MDELSIVLISVIIIQSMLLGVRHKQLKKYGLPDTKTKTQMPEVKPPKDFASEHGDFIDAFNIENGNYTKEEIDKNNKAWKDYCHELGFGDKNEEK